MKRKEAWIKARYVRIFWAVMAVLLCAAPSVWADIDITEDVPVDLTVASGTTVNLYANVLGPFGITVEPDSYLNIYSGNVTGFFGITVLTGAIDAEVTVYGTDFAITIVSGTATFDDPDNPTQIIPDPDLGWSGVLTGTYGELICFS
jgi:hypothetical protein